MRSLAVLSTLLATVSLGAVQSTLAAVKTWSCANSSGNWSTGSNWIGGTIPATNDTVVFDCAVTTNADLGSVNIAAVVFGPSSAGAIINGAFVLNGNAATLNIDDQATAATPNSINASITLANSLVYVKSGVSGHVLSLSGAISGGTAGANEVMRIYGPGAVQLRRISGAANTYTGRTFVASADGNGGNGVLQVGGFNRVVVPGDLTVGSGTGSPTAPDRPQVQWQLPEGVSDTSKVNVAVDGLLALDTRFETIAKLTGLGTVTSTSTNAALTVGDAGNFTWGGVISGPGGMTKVGTGTMTITAPNTYTGLTTVSRGTLVLNAPLIGGTGRAINGPLVIGSGVGTVVAATVLFANNFQIDSSTLPLAINSDGRLDTAGFGDDVGPLTINGGNFAIGNNVQQFGGLTMNGGTISGTGTLVLRASNLVATATVALGAASIGSTVELGFGTDTFTVNSGSAQPELTINGAVTAGLLSANLIKAGTGTLRLAGTAANTYGGSTTIAQGVLDLAKPNSVVAITGPIVIGNNTDPPGSATLKNLATNQIGGKPRMTISASGVYGLNGFSDDIGGLAGGGVLNFPSLSALGIDVSNGSQMFAGSVTGSGSGTTLQKSGAGEQVFTGSGVPSVTAADVLGGRLTINTQMAFASAAVNVQSSAELSGNGRMFSLQANSGASVRPGNGSGGTLSIDGDATFRSGSVLIADLLSTNLGYFSTLDVQGTVAIEPNVALDLRAAPAFSAANSSSVAIIVNDGADAIQGTFRGLPEGRSLPAGARNVSISYAGGTGNDALLTVRPTLDIDGDSQYLAETDGLLIARHIGGLTGATLAANAIAGANGAKRTAQSDVSAYLTYLGNSLDVNQSGVVDTTDRVLILRWLFGFRGEALVTGFAIPPGSTAEQYADTIRNQLEQLTP